MYVKTTYKNTTAESINKLKAKDVSPNINHTQAAEVPKKMLIFAPCDLDL